MGLQLADIVLGRLVTGEARLAHYNNRAFADLGLDRKVLVVFIEWTRARQAAALENFRSTNFVENL